MEPDLDFHTLAAQTDATEHALERAPARLKSTIYSAMVQRQVSTGPLLSLSAVKAAGHALCVFEDAVQAIPVSDRVKAMNPCRVCHARLLAERFESPPIVWPHCPYVQFHRR